jgi:hypothetical protein
LRPQRFTHYVAVDLTGLSVIAGRAYVYVVLVFMWCSAMSRSRCAVAWPASGVTDLRYMKVLWDHDLQDEPITLYSECDDAGWEIRKVDVFRDGRLGHASRLEARGGTQLGEAPLPSVAEIAAHREFRPSEISQADFEAVWAAAHEDASVAG